MKIKFISMLLWLALIPCMAAEKLTPADVAALQVAADGGDAEARFQLGRALLRGEGVPKDVDKAFALMKAAAEQGHADAMSGVGYFYDQGVSVPKDAHLAVEWFRKGAEEGSAKAELNLGKSLLAGKDEHSKEEDAVRAEALQWIHKAADQGLPEAAFSYGEILYFGNYGKPQDFKVAMPYLKTAAEHGIPDAQNMLGSMYQCGSGPAIDDGISEQWYRKAALQGHARAQANLGNILGPLNEDHTKRIEALAWLLMASEKDDVTAKKTLAQSIYGLKPGDMKEAEKQRSELRKLVKQ